MEENREHQTFHVGLKAFIVNGEKLLVLQDEDGLWELPGGRTEKTEIHKDLKEILTREITEELGKDIQYEIGPIFHAWIRKPAPAPGNTDETYTDKDFCIFLIGFRCSYKQGTVQLSSEHQDFRWITKEESDALEFENTYKQAIKKYFEIS